MPNWQSNCWELVGERPEAVAAVRKVLEDEDGLLTFDHLAPMPKVLERTVSPRDTPTMFEGSHEAGDYRERSPTSLERFEIWVTGARDWWEWQIREWGVKWGPSSCGKVAVSDDGCEAVYYFFTPWGPPDGFLDKVRDFVERMQEEHGGDHTWYVEVRPWSYDAG